MHAIEWNGSCPCSVEELQKSRRCSPSSRRFLRTDARQLPPQCRAGLLVALLAETLLGHATPADEAQQPSAIKSGAGSSISSRAGRCLRNSFQLAAEPAWLLGTVSWDRPNGRSHLHLADLAHHFLWAPKSKECALVLVGSNKRQMGRLSHGRRRKKCLTTACREPPKKWPPSRG